MMLMLFFISTVEAQVYIFEAMPAPASGYSDSEWLSIYNHSETDIDISGWYIDDIAIPSDTLIPAADFIIFSPDPAMVSKRFPMDNTKVMQLDISLRNAGKKIALRLPGGEVIDQVQYLDSSSYRDRAWYRKGWAEETLELHCHAYFGSSFPSAELLDNSCPQLSITELVVGEYITIANDSGMDVAAGSGLKAIWSNGDIVQITQQLPANSQLRIRIDDVGDLSPGESVVLKLGGNKLDEWAVEQQTIQSDLQVGDIQISRLYPAPLDTESEWVELLNTTTRDLNLMGSYLIDESARSFDLDIIIPAETSVKVEPQFALNNGGDTVSLYGTDGQLLDQLQYKAASAGEEIHAVSPTPSVEPKKTVVTAVDTKPIPKDITTDKQPGLSTVVTDWGTPISKYQFIGQLAWQDLGLISVSQLLIMGILAVAVMGGIYDRKWISLRLVQTIELIKSKFADWHRQILQRIELLNRQGLIE